MLSPPFTAIILLFSPRAVFRSTGRSFQACLLFPNCLPAYLVLQQVEASIIQPLRYQQHLAFVLNINNMLFHAIAASIIVLLFSLPVFIATPLDGKGYLLLHFPPWVPRFHGRHQLCVKSQWSSAR